MQRRLDYVYALVFFLVFFPCAYAQTNLVRAVDTYASVQFYELSISLKSIIHKPLVQKGRSREEKGKQKKRKAKLIDATISGVLPALCVIFSFSFFRFLLHIKNVTGRVFLFPLARKSRSHDRLHGPSSARATYPSSSHLKIE